MNTLGNRAIDRRTTIGKALAAWRSELLADLGGLESVSTQELPLVEEAVKTKLILDSVGHRRTQQLRPGWWSGADAALLSRPFGPC